MPVNHLTLISFLAASAMAGAAVAQDRPMTPVEAQLSAADGASLGRVTLREGPQGLLLTIEGEGWPEGWHGAHLHAVGSCEPPSFQSAGGHVNHPEATRPHGLLNWEGGPDFGDLQNVYAGPGGSARAEVYLARGHGETTADMLSNANGLALVIHANPDDHVTQPIGGAGDRIACAVLLPAGQASAD